MAHLFYLRSAPSFSMSPSSVYGTQEQVEMAINKRRYPVDNIRKGYNTPFESKLTLVNTRIKEECIPQFVADLGRWVINRENETITLKEIFFDKTRSNWTQSINKSFLIGRWLFKWINKKKVTPLILVSLGVVTFQWWLFLIALAVYLNPVKPVPYNEKLQQNKFVKTWCYHIILGKLKDPTEYKKDTNEPIQEDVL